MVGQKSVGGFLVIPEALKIFLDIIFIVVPFKISFNKMGSVLVSGNVFITSPLIYHLLRRVYNTSDASYTHSYYHFSRNVSITPDSKNHLLHLTQNTSAATCALNSFLFQNNLGSNAITTSTSIYL